MSCDAEEPFSPGPQRRFQLATVFLKSPSLWFLDLQNVTSSAAATGPPTEVETTVFEIRGGLTLMYVMATHFCFR